MKKHNLESWHKEVCERDGYVCQLQIAPECKKDYSFDLYFDAKGKNQYVCGDHLKTQKSHPTLRYDTENGRCVCSPCHTLRHKGHELPEGYLSSADKFAPQIERLRAPEKRPRTIAPEDLCSKCKKWRAVELTGICLACSRTGKPIFKEEKKKKRKH